MSQRERPLKVKGSDGHFIPASLCGQCAVVFLAVNAPFLALGSPGPCDLEKQQCCDLLLGRPGTNSCHIKGVIRP